MAATGGGKIRTRRYHIASKPYAKGKQVGLISRVTDTVKSIVPSWLQKYFKNDEVVEVGGPAPETETNAEPSPSNGNGESVPLQDGKNVSEPNSTNTEPSTSSASLNFQDVLSRPPLNRTHLHFPSLDASPSLGVANSLFSHPSTSTAPFSGASFAVASSSFSLVKEIKDSSSQHEDDNISTTSGFSSRASDKDVPNSKPAPLIWSPETERTHSGPQPVQSGLRKPAFNLSVFSQSSATAMNSSMVNSRQLGDSPFYPGKTTYGGAAAARSAHLRPGTPYHAPVRRQIKAKPVGTQPCGVTSATARRILQSLERMSTPLADAKRIPSTVSSPVSTKPNMQYVTVCYKANQTPPPNSLDHSDVDISYFQSKKKRLESAFPPVQKLMIPTVASVGGNRSISFRPSLTPAGVSRTVEKTNKEMPVRQFTQIADPTPIIQSTSILSYPLSSTPASNNTGSGGGKMKRERTIRPSLKRPEDEITEIPDLPAISLPINTCSLPTFSFSSPPQTSSLSTATQITTVPEESVSTKDPPGTSTPPCVPFTFSSPIVKATAASPPSFTPSSGFTFSAPAMKAGPTPKMEAVLDFVPVKSSANDGTEEFEGSFKPAKVLKQGSVLDILKGPAPATTTKISTSPVSGLLGFGDKFKKPEGAWNCEVCMIENKAQDVKCVACQSTKPGSMVAAPPQPDASTPASTAPPTGFGDKFKNPIGSWGCEVCCIVNKAEDQLCVACQSVKPGAKMESTASTPATTAPIIGFGDKFKKPIGSWECEVCCLANKTEDQQCVACQSVKPGAKVESKASTPTTTAPLSGFGDKFKKPVGSWECEVCCVANKAEDQQCVACQSVKPGAKVESKGFGSSSSNQLSTSDSASCSFKFGLSSAEAASGLKIGGASTESGSGFKFGGSSSDASGGFKFGGAFTANNSTSSTGGFKFGTTSLEISSSEKNPSGGFKFGISSEGFKTGSIASSASANGEKKIESQSSGGGFKFGGNSGISVGTPTDTGTTTGGFSFGLSTPQTIAEKKETTPSSETVTNSETTTIPVFGKSAVAEPAIGAPKVKESTLKESTLANSSFTFGSKPEERDSSMSSGGFLFSAGKEAPLMSFSFSKQEPPNDQSKSTLVFGKSEEKSEHNDPPNPSFSFGQSASDLTATKPSFGFMTSSSSSPAPSAPAPSLFGTPSGTAPTPAPSQAPAPSSAFVFGQSSSSDAPSAKAFQFGQPQQDSQPASGAALAAPSQPFLFGSAVSTGPPSFSFGAAAAAAPASAVPTPTGTSSPFGFSPATSSSGFGPAQAPAFGQATSQTSGSAFGSAGPTFSATASQPPVFGANSTAAPVFGQQPNPSPAFGSSTASTGQGGFQFGAVSAFGASSGATGVFTFGGSGASPAASPALPTQPTATGVGFTFAQPPPFNMGSAKNSLSASPAVQQPISGRKIKTAVRRRK